MGQKGLAQVLVLIIILLGLGVGVYLVQKQTSLKSRASVETAENALALVGYTDASKPVTLPSDNISASGVPNQELIVDLLIRANTDPINLISAKLKFSSDILEVVRFEKSDLSGGVSVVEEYFDNKTGEISFVGGIPNPGYQSSVGKWGLAKKIVFKVKDGTNGKKGTIEFLEEGTAIYKNSDNAQVANLIKKSLPVQSGTTVVVASPIPSLSSTSVSGETQELKTWMLIYKPSASYNPPGTGDPVAFTRNTYFPALSEGTKYHGYSNSSAKPALRYTLVDENIKVEYNPPPKINGRYDYSALFKKYDLCNLAKQKDIKAVVLWADGSGEYAGGMWESAVTGNKGIPTNGGVYPELCDKTIVVYGLNYTRGLAEALESYGHHLERVFGKYRPEYASWSDDSASKNPGLHGRGDSCGNDHNPPNARFEYDRANTANFQSDCRNWKPDGSGAKETLNCNVWKCDGAEWHKWWMQNMPGIGNNLVGTDGKPIPNWWRLIGEPDTAVLDYLPKPGTFSNLAAKLGENSASFSFDYSGTTTGLKIDLSVTADLSWGVYLDFARGSKSPVIENNPKKWDAYACGKTLYWRAYDEERKVQSSIQKAVVECVAKPSPSPAACAQVITPAINTSTKECKDFPNACLPEGWTKLKGESCAKAGDLAGDGKFDLGRNFSILFSKFNNPDGSKPQGYEKADINGDGVINVVDVSLMRNLYIGKGKVKEKGSGNVVTNTVQTIQNTINNLLNR
ncbi:MAG: hypothetical protein US86_C0004G0057 [Candidatus Daviesbacteria bacterium GW2011_GWA2_38_24]|uniref:Dockerin domain-containing protein n=1 Tax=Candidatus Daviesbacteria bacterium GW2011_GWA2_38_24 TaxID=1618422 RepID=A0A0G0LZE2_9BACT|nr:MAG: hypothetical protein US86_C0004G0057 [Candidatus Daviesbacteria bacterium GW2011_GWA2_38_24]KKQ80086.1 MAG: hypothetical protein UT01_C0020G0003 [Candidatus Daviesbacteria bacterium GW2011_GWA1_38_7]